ncbi:S8 family serine peptidase [Paenibacillus sp. GP183]|uniref:S8 family peptidase n=1 Tax=Paenibacillus sp. GP183 TaxID=1882751 RepID=UPI00089A2254|nr:S8 family serine peptidase [Paenibacillus sp. GP183]SEC33215.1 Serine protease, subtilisin family [Paenibacillus sp. GP183]
MNRFYQLILLICIILAVEGAGITVQVQAAPSLSTDPMRVKQTYLDLIHIDAAWAAAGVNSSSVIVAVVDTGVDLTHPDLEGKLVDGINLINPGTKPLDDNGHGTNVAGIIAASLNNDKGIAGIAPNAKIMPIKALESDGTGGELKLGQGVRYAVDHGAQIVVLSLGLNKSSNELSAAIQYAEDHHVLLVAASGNEGTSIKYPAAYPTVLAVGGVTADKHADYRSNFGPELDLVAPWDVFTTKLGGGYEYKDGTSMSAPQVAGVAALLLGKYPQMTPLQVREQLLQSAEDLETPGWDATTGYGLLRADLALTKPFNPDRFEPNNSKQQASSIPVQAIIHSSLSSGQDQDWFVMDCPYDGTVKVTIRSADGTVILLRAESALTGSGITYSAGTAPTSIEVKKGRTYLQLQTADRQRLTSLNYSLQTEFQIYRDQFENNDKQYQAFTLPARTQTIRGTFHQKGDVDWFMLPLATSGTLRIRCSVDTGRIDPVILFQKKGEKSMTIDQAGDGATEITPEMELLPGDYYIRISNAKDFSEPITGEYTLSIEYTPKLLDPNEPNDKPYQATFAGLFTDYPGLFHSNQDEDWFEVRLSNEGLTQLSVTNIPLDRTLYGTLYDNSLNEKFSFQNLTGNSSLFVEQKLPAGTYYIKLRANESFLDQMYHFKAGVYLLNSGYIDISGHWAADPISNLTRKELISGYGNYRFAPDRPITRAEASAMLVKAFQLTKLRDIQYTDLNPEHWAYSYIAKTEQAGLVEGYPDQSFQPDRTLTRMEMTQMLAKRLNMAGKRRGDSPFTDVSNEYWGVGILKQMWADGWISGYPDVTFRPEEQATRAEFAMLLDRILNR